MSIPTPEEIANAILDQLKKDHHTFWIDPEMHSEQHKFIQVLIDERAEKVARRKALEDKIAGSLVLSFVLTTIGLVGAGVIAWLKDHIK